MPRYDIVGFLKNNGPSTPIQVAQYFKISSIFASAFLSSAVSSGEVKITHLKIGGGSPLYYLPEHKSQLQNFISKLNQKDRQACELLKEQTILEDRTQSPIIRVSLRSIKDFAIPFNASINNEQVLFWKWFLVSDSEAEQLVLQRNSSKQNTDRAQTTIQTNQKLSESSQNQNTPVSSQTQENSKLSSSLNQKDKINQSTQSSQLSNSSASPSKNLHSESQNEQTQKQSTPHSSPSSNSSVLGQKASEQAPSKVIPSSGAVQPKQNHDNPEVTPHQTVKNQDSSIQNRPLSSQKPSQTQAVDKEKQNKMISIAVSSVPSQSQNTHDNTSKYIEKTYQITDGSYFDEACKSSFDKKLQNLFSQKNITVITYYAQKRSSDKFLKIKVPTSVGSAVFICKALAKKTINEGDIAFAVVESYFLKTSLLIVYSGKLTKKAQLYKETLFNDVQFIKI
ncbi:MAG: hypothetical protein ACMXYE_01705 [Candidatus Woesearchaeota archaeon]